MAETRREKRERRQKEAFESVWKNQEIRKVPTIVRRGITATPQALPPVEQPPRKSGWHLLLYDAHQFGFTHPHDGRFLMLPPEFDAILALETKAVAQVILEVMRQTIGWGDAAGRHGRREWVKLGHKHFERICGSSSQAFTGLKVALQKGYVLRRPCTGGFEYAIHWREGGASDTEGL
jgi:hypothetical protein